MTVCPACGNENPAGSRFCNGCGAPLAPVAQQREERKVVTVVFADLVGSTARAEALDPEDVQAILLPYHARLRQALEQFGGTVEKFIGDAVVGVFGAPATHEDDAERAVRAALEIQEVIAELNGADPAWELEVRIGVNTGEVLVNLAARPELGEGMVSGDVMNTAARLQSAAPAGGVLVGEQTYRATDRVIEFSDHPAVEAKGKAEPVRVWRAIGPRARLGLEDVALGRAPLVGRQREVALLADAFERVRSDERPQLVTLVGVPGIGKSRLVHELSEIVDADPELIVWRRGRSLPYGEGVAYWALGEIVKAQAGILESDGADTAAAKLQRAVDDLVSDRAEAAWIERHLGALVGLAAGDAQPSRAQAFAARRRFLEALAERGPAVLVFEDLHWADDDLLDFVDELTDRLDSVPLLIVGTARPELLTRRPGWGGGKLNAVTLSLAPLSGEETTRLVHELLGRSALPAETQAEIAGRAGGVPLFAEEMVRMFEDGQPTTGLPETLQGIVAARIDGLAPTEKELLHDAAVLGKVFWTDALSTISGLDGDELDACLRSLERREFVRRERRSAVEGARQYVFLHAVVRDVAYGQIPRAARCAKHRATAAWISGLPADRADDRAETLAHHLESAIAYGEAASLDVDDLRPAAVAALREAGDRAWALTIATRAARFYRRALDASPGETPDPELLFLRGRAQLWAEGLDGDPTEVLQAAIDGLVAAGERDLAALAAMTLYRRLWNNQVMREDLVDLAVELVAGGAPTDVRCEALSHLATVLAIRGDGQEALPFAEEAVAIARTNEDRAAEAHALNSLGVAQDVVGETEQGIASITRALELGLESGSIDAPRCCVNLASLEWELGLLAESADHQRQGYALATRLELTSFRDWTLREIHNIEYVLGDWDAALPGARECLGLSRQRGEPHILDIPLQIFEAAMVLAREGVLLEDQLEEAIERGRAVGDPQTLEPTLAEAALVLAQAGRRDAARTLIEELAETGTHRGSAMASATLAWTHVSDEPVPWAARAGRMTPWLEAAGRVGSGDAGGAADILATIGARAPECEARLIAASELATSDPVEALRQLALARGFLRSVGAAARLAGLDELAAALRPAAS